MDVTVTVPGSCGELVQGYEQGRPFLVTLPVNRYASVRIMDDGKRVRPSGWKGCMALQKGLAYWQIRDFPYSVYVSTQLPYSKGMASSSAEIGAILTAAAAVLGKQCTDQELAYLAASVEPTDGVFCKGWCCLDYNSGKILHTYAPLPLHIAVIDTGGTVDTLRFHDACRQVSMETRLRRQLLWEPWDYERMGKAAVLSAMANQEILYKPGLHELQQAAAALGAVGINAAHSGTVLGMLFPAAVPVIWIETQVREMLHRTGCPGMYMDTVSAVSGGYTIRWNDE